MAGVQRLLAAELQRQQEEARGHEQQCAQLLLAARRHRPSPAPAAAAAAAAAASLGRKRQHVLTAEEPGERVAMAEEQLASYHRDAAACCRQLTERLRGMLAEAQAAWEELAHLPAAPAAAPRWATDGAAAAAAAGPLAAPADPAAAAQQPAERPSLAALDAADASGCARGALASRAPDGASERNRSSEDGSACLPGEGAASGAPGQPAELAACTTGQRQHQQHQQRQQHQRHQHQHQQQTFAASAVSSGWGLEVEAALAAVQLAQLAQRPAVAAAAAAASAGTGGCECWESVSSRSSSTSKGGHSGGGSGSGGRKRKSCRSGGEASAKAAAAAGGGPGEECSDEDEEDQAPDDQPLSTERSALLAFGQRLADAALRAAPQQGGPLGDDQLLQLLRPVEERLRSEGALGRPVDRQARVPAVQLPGRRRVGRPAHGGGGGEVPVVCYSDLERVFGLTAEEACAALPGCPCLSTLKLMRGRFGIDRWPQRKFASLAAERQYLLSRPPSAKDARQVPGRLALVDHALALLRRHPNMQLERHPASVVTQVGHKQRCKAKKRARKSGVGDGSGGA